MFRGGVGLILRLEGVGKGIFAHNNAERTFISALYFLGA